MEGAAPLGEPRPPSNPPSMLPIGRRREREEERPAEMKWRAIGKEDVHVQEEDAAAESISRPGAGAHHVRNFARTQLQMSASCKRLPTSSFVKFGTVTHSRVIVVKSCGTVHRDSLDVLM